ncbi:hypothetical protein RJ640_019730 [Escallonia rubra]|uniref:Bifunctional inhibitor/plant lipid transfer protein/seed storage helical domain-containing protein n=1 Tax=Escallonia rubra TaxID=112253 RepID=A0AA88R1L0_9ASTE|nr:hypothetical protein RJ640_019730 [Escallonia rubra]
MECAKAIPCLNAVLAALLILSIISVEGQISTPCTASMITSFTPCINFITGSTGNGASPTAGCCDSLRSLTGSSMDCACLIITGNVPFSLPINRTLSISLPRACKSGGVPIQCKGPVLFVPSPSPAVAASPFSPRASKASALAPPPAETTEEIPPASPPVDRIAPTATTGIRPVLTPTSAADQSYISPLLLLFKLPIRNLAVATATTPAQAPTAKPSHSDEQRCSCPGTPQTPASFN